MTAAPLQYTDFVVQILSDGAETYRLLTTGEAGQENAPFVPPPALAALAPAAAGGSRDLALGSGRVPMGLGRDAATDAMAPEEIGDLLFRALFSGHVAGLFERSLGRADAAPRRGLRLLIQIDYRDPAAAWLSDLPWELLYSAAEGRFLALSRTSPVVRTAVVPRRAASGPLAASRRALEILAVAAGPAGLPHLDLERERRFMEAALVGKELANLTWAEAPDRDALRRHLLERPVDVLHFMGHGHLDPATGHGEIFLASPDGGVTGLSDDGLVQMIDRDRGPGLVVLNACLGGRAGTPRHARPAGLAPALVQAGLPAVVAMREPISDDAAIAWSSAFYGALALGNPVEIAVTEGRKAIQSQDPASLEWATPMLFSGAATPFAIRRPPSPVPEPSPPAEPWQQAPAIIGRVQAGDISPRGSTVYVAGVQLGRIGSGPERKGD